MEFLSQRRDRTNRKSVSNKVRQIVWFPDRFPEYFPTAEDLRNSLCFHIGLLAIYDTPLGHKLQALHWRANSRSGDLKVEDRELANRAGVRISLAHVHEASPSQPPGTVEK